MKILSAEYNEYVVGYVISTDKGDINVQFEKIHSNHPEPDYCLTPGCTGDDTHRAFSDDEIAVIKQFIRDNKEMSDLEDAFTAAMYNGSDFNEKTAPICKWEIEEAAEYAEE